MSVLVTTVVMATLVVGPFYLTGALTLDAASAGLAMSSGPLMAALTGIPAGRLIDRLGAQQSIGVGLLGMLAGCCLLPLMPTAFGAFGYTVPLMIMTAGYALFQAANNTAVMSTVTPQQRGVMSGLLGLSRNLGLITGASLMGAVFASATASGNILQAPADAIVTGMRVTFAVAAALIVLALVIGTISRRFSLRRPNPC
jgi:MFS family permease